MQNGIMLVMYGKMIFRCFWISYFNHSQANACSVYALFFCPLFSSVVFLSELMKSHSPLKKKDKPQDNFKFINDQPTAYIVYLNNQLLQHSN